MSLQLLEAQAIALPAPSGARKARSSSPGRKRKDEQVAELLAALQQAQEERDAKGAFLSYIAHELRTPLNAMAGMAELLTDSQLSADQREMVGIIRRSGEHLVGMLNNALDWARLEAGKMDLAAQPFGVRSCVEECLDLLAAAAADKGIELAYVMDSATPPMVLGDGNRLRQVLVNLVSNAVKFSLAGEVIIAVKAHATGYGRHEIGFAVSDTGPGIPAERLDEVFEEFSQVRDIRSPRHGGSGLGLSIARRLVDMMGGTIRVESTIGLGSTFHFTILAEAVGSESRASSLEPALAGKRLLIVDSNASVGRLLAETVGQWGIVARSSSDLSEALGLLKGGEPVDAVLLDGHAPDRRAFTSAIRRLPEGEALPLVLLTSLNTKGIDESLAGSGGRARFAAYLSKPVHHEKLREVLAQVFTPSRPSADHAVTRAKRAVRAAVERTPPAEPAGDLAGVRVVIADDDPTMRELLERVLGAEGIDVVSAADGVEALEEIKRWEPDVVLLDVTMPRLNGFDVLRRLKNDERTRLTPVVLVTGLRSQEDRVLGIDAGADDILTKPWERSELLARVRALARLKRFTSDLDRVEAVLVAMARCMESRDPDTHGHCERLSDYASRLGQRIGLEEADVNALRLAGIVHDIGKIAVPDAILFKPGPLTPDEWTVMREHPAEGERICSGLSAFRRVLPVIRHHHEKLDGSGYPDGLPGAEIPVTARVLQVVDVYDALTTKRHYKPAMSPLQALDILQGEVDKGWRDGKIFEAFQDLVLEDIRRSA